MIGPQELGPSKKLFIEPYQTAAPHDPRHFSFTIDSSLHFHHNHIHNHVKGTRMLGLLWYEKSSAFTGTTMHFNSLDIPRHEPGLT